MFRRLELENFGAFPGRQKLDLSPLSGRPLTLIGGHNGSGKTTLMKAITIALHGRRAMASGISQTQYLKQMDGLTHLPVEAGDAVGMCGVSLALTREEGGQDVEYVVSRHFSRTKDGNLRERLSLKRGSETLSSARISDTQALLDDLLPPGLARLVIFDGEKVQALADDSSGRELRVAVDRLIGLDLLDRLQDDLMRYASRDSAESGGLAEAHKRANAAVEAATRKLSALESELEALEVERKTAIEQADRARDQFVRKGGALAHSRAQTELKKSKVEGVAERARAELEELCAGLLPITLAGDLVERLSQRLQRERVAQENAVVVERIDRARRKLSEHLSSKGGRLSPARIVEELLTDDADDAPPLLDLAPTARALVLARLEVARDTLPLRAAEAAARLRKAELSIERLNWELAQAPEAEEVAPLLTELHDRDRQVGVLDERISAFTVQLRQARHEQAVAERAVRKAKEAYVAAHQSEERQADALRAAMVIRDFAVQTTEAKIDEVALASARYFNRLSRKGRLLAAVEIDSETFTLRVKRWDQAWLSKEQLSAGERQILAVSLLWALTTVSGRAMPVVIDTPLARLDETHRELLLDEYLPNVSHQVIVLATDSEIDASVSENLEGFVARRYLLRHNTAVGETRIESGYFPEAVSDAG